MVEHNILEAGDGQLEGCEVPHSNVNNTRQNNNNNINNNNHSGNTVTSLSPSSDTGPHGDVGFCAGCGGRIVDRYYLCTVNKPWHCHCLRCSECQVPLDTQATCFAKDGSIYCKQDYYKRFATKSCARCHVTITASELVIRARDLVYHLACFTCVACQKVLTTGEHYGLRDGMVFCQAHYDHDHEQHQLQPQHQQHQQQQQQQSPPCGSIPGSGSPPEYMDIGVSPPGPPPPLIQAAPFYNGVGATPKPGRPRKRKNQAVIQGNDMQLGMTDPDLLGFSQDGFPMQGNSRQKRMRTSFKHQQLRIMKSYFTLNHNPDAKDLTQLSQKTGLAKRVLQVWFQNARAKHRRTQVRKDGAEGVDTQEHSPGGSSIHEDSISADDMLQLGEMPKSPALSDISSSASLTDLHNTSLTEAHAQAHVHDQQQQRQQQPHNSSLAELYNTMNSIG